VSALLDVNALIALVDSDHVSHQSMRQWFLNQHQKGWATSPITENGLIRVLSQATYPSGQRLAAEAIQILIDLKAAFPDSYEFWTDDVSLADESRFRKEMIGGHRQVTDVYLLGQAAARAGTLVSFDRSLAWQAVQGGSEQLVQRPD
jgi:toxin-antitoxin system PIN domain toxin